MKKSTFYKAGEWLLDVAKYTLTATVVVSFLGEFTEQKAVYYSARLAFIAICFITGLIIVDKTENKKL